MIAIGSDHAGYALKMHILKYLQDKGYDIRDYGCYSEESVNYALYGEKVAKAVASGEAEKGIVICGTGIGISLAANKVRGIRCALCHEEYSAEMTRRHNDANMLAMGGRVTGPALAEAITDVFLNTEFEGGRHQARIDEITRIENER